MCDSTVSYYLKRYCSLTSNVRLGKKGYLNTMYFDEWPLKWPCTFCTISLQSVQGNVLNLEAAAYWNHVSRCKEFIHLMALPFPQQYLIFLCFKDWANTYVFILGFLFVCLFSLFFILDHLMTCPNLWMYLSYILGVFLL